MPALSWRHHTLIQALLSRGPLKEKDFHSIFAGVTGKNPDVHQTLFNEYLRTINMELSYVQFELRACRNQYDGNVYYGVINNIADEQSKLGTKYTVPQIAFYKSIIEAIVQDATAQGCISNIDALNVQLENQVNTGAGYSSQGNSSQVPAAFRNFSMSQKEKTIEEFVQEKWLCAMTDGRIGLGVRSFLDLRSWFHNNEVPPCDVCNEAGVKAELCRNQSCNVRIHEYCLKRKFSQRRVEKVCPGCGEEWPYTVAKAEAVEEEFADVNVVSTQDQPPSSQQSMRKRLRSSRNVEEEDEGGPSQSQPPPQPSSRKKRGSSRIVEEDDEDGPSQSQLPPLPSSRKKVRTSEFVHAETITSQPKQEPSETRRVTRNSARLRSGN